jgi:hypothetical protein
MASEGTLYPLLARLRRAAPGSRRWDVWAPWLISLASWPHARGSWLFGEGFALHASAGCTTKGFTLPLGIAILLVVAGLAAHLLPPIHLMRTRRQQHFTLA